MDGAGKASTVASKDAAGQPATDLWQKETETVPTGQGPDDEKENVVADTSDEITATPDAGVPAFPTVMLRRDASKGASKRGTFEQVTVTSRSSVSKIRGGHEEAADEEVETMIEGAPEMTGMYS